MSSSKHHFKRPLKETSTYDLLKREIENLKSLGTSYRGASVARNRGTVIPRGSQLKSGQNARARLSSLKLHSGAK